MPPAHKDDDALKDIVTTAALDLTRTLAAASSCADRSLLVQSVADAMDACMERLGTTGVWGPSNRIPSQAFWRIAGELLGQGALQVHAREKPYGYAGDHEMLGRICDNDRRGDGLTFAFDDYFQRQAAPRAVRNRAALVAEQVVCQVRGCERQVKIVSVGSGPAHDISLAAQQLEAEERSRLEVHLIDLDPRAIAYAEHRLSTNGSVQVGSLYVHRKNLKRLDRDLDTTAILGSADLISCPGFFDYLTDQEVAEMLSLFYAHLRQGGSLLAFNFAENNPSRAYMEWVGNWYLVYRTADRLREARQAARLPADAEQIGCEAEHVNLFIRAQKL